VVRCLRLCDFLSFRFSWLNIIQVLFIPFHTASAIILTALLNFQASSDNYLEQAVKKLRCHWPRLSGFASFHCGRRHEKQRVLETLQCIKMWTSQRKQSCWVLRRGLGSEPSFPNNRLSISAKNHISPHQRRYKELDMAWKVAQRNLWSMDGNHSITLWDIWYYYFWTKSHNNQRW
jgi:hypothetical protein